MREKMTTAEARQTVERVLEAMKSDPSLKQKDALQKYGLNVSTFNNWRKKLKAEGRKKREPSTMTVTEIMPPKLGGKTLLIVTDDQETIRNIMEKFL